MGPQQYLSLETTSYYDSVSIQNHRPRVHMKSAKLLHRERNRLSTIGTARKRQQHRKLYPQQQHNYVKPSLKRMQRKAHLFS